MIVVPRAGLEPARDKFPQDFKSCASTDFATKAFISICCCFLTHKYSISISQLIFIVNTFFKIFLIFSFGCIRYSNIMLKYIIKTKIFHFFLLIFVTKECLLVRNNLTNILWNSKYINFIIRFFYLSRHSIVLNSINSQHILL